MHSPQCQTFRPFMSVFRLQLVMTFLSSSLKALVAGLPSVRSVLQQLVFKMFFHNVLFTAPSLSPGGNEKVILIFQRSPVNYNTGLNSTFPIYLRFLFFEAYFW